MPSPEMSTFSGDQSVDELRRELAEAREQQAATAEILSVISRSPMDLQRACGEIAASAARLLGAYDTFVHRLDGNVLRCVARHGPNPSGLGTLPLTRGLVAGRALLDRRATQVADLQAEAHEYPEGSERARHAGIRTLLVVPLMRAGEAIGVIGIRRTEARLFSDKQIALLETFANQAVIAVENTRLFEAEQASKHELQESLEYQTATSEVLGVISRSPAELQPVLDTIVDTALRLCAADRAYFHVSQKGRFHLVATKGAPENVVEDIRTKPIAPSRGSSLGRALLEMRPIHIEDARIDPEFTLYDANDPNRAPTLLSVPLLREDGVIGVITVARMAVAPFARRQIDLITTFASQAVIAINNVDLFEEVQARTRELARTVEELEIASQHKSQFVANMSHELRTPLAAMLGYAELLQEGIYGALPEKSRPILTRISSNGKHLLGLINMVLDISKIEAGQFKLNLAEYALGSIVETVVVATESLAATKRLGFKTDVGERLPIGIGDEQRLTQVLLNLVGNAIKFTDAGEVRITAGAANGHFTVSVRDTGPGIPTEECERIFEKFRQVDSSNTRAKGGTGLGLAIAREIVEMHGGRIWVESTMGQGSTFRMELPVRAAAGAA